MPVTTRMTTDFQHPSGDRVPMTTDLSWSELDPYAVVLTFHQNSGPQTWIIGRDLLVGGMTGEHWTGQGDVRATRLGEEIGVVLDNGTAECLLFVPLSPMSAFLAETLIVTPLGDELVADEVLFGAVLPTTDEPAR